MATPEENKWAQPQEVSDLDVAFPARGGELTPKYQEVPAEFREDRGNPWSRFVSTWFYEGDPLSKFNIAEKEGVDPTKAFRHLQVVLSTWGTKHEHKMAGAAWLASLWFEKIEDLRKKEGQ